MCVDKSRWLVHHLLAVVQWVSKLDQLSCLRKFVGFFTPVEKSSSMRSGSLLFLLYCSHEELESLKIICYTSPVWNILWRWVVSASCSDSQYIDTQARKVSTLIRKSVETPNWLKVRVNTLCWNLTYDIKKIRGSHFQNLILLCRFFDSTKSPGMCACLRIFFYRRYCPTLCVSYPSSLSWTCTF